MYPIRAAVSSDLDEVVDVLARLQAEPAHHIAYHGQTAEEIAGELTGMCPDWTTATMLATDPTGRLRGLLSIDASINASTGAGRARLHGPYVDVPANHPAAATLWHQTADALLDEGLRAARLAGIGELELCGHRRHRLLADFAARHDFVTGRTSRVFVLSGPAMRAVLVRDTGRAAVSGATAVDRAVRTLPDDPAVRAAVAALHERSFPGGAAPGRRLGTPEGGVVVLTGARGLIGYAAGYPRDGELLVDQVAVDPDRRSRGAGRALVRGLLRELAERHGARASAVATTTLGNDAAERMLTGLGFTVHLELVCYRKKI